MHSDKNKLNIALNNQLEKKTAKRKRLKDKTTKKNFPIQLRLNTEVKQ